MIIYLILLFTVIPLLELVLLMRAGQIIGIANTIVVVILTGSLGAFLAKQQGIATLKKLQNEIAQGKIPQDAILDSVLILISGILLLTPGFITDILGIFWLIPPTRDISKKWIKRKIRDMIDRGRTISVNSYKVNE